MHISTDARGGVAGSNGPARAAAPRLSDASHGTNRRLSRPPSMYSPAALGWIGVGQRRHDGTADVQSGQRCRSRTCRRGTSTCRYELAAYHLGLPCLPLDGESASRRGPAVGADCRPPTQSHVAMTSSELTAFSGPLLIGYVALRIRTPGRRARRRDMERHRQRTPWGTMESKYSARLQHCSLIRPIPGCSPPSNASACCRTMIHSIQPFRRRRSRCHRLMAPALTNLQMLSSCTPCRAKTRSDNMRLVANSNPMHHNNSVSDTISLGAHSSSNSWLT